MKIQKRLTQITLVGVVLVLAFALPSLPSTPHGQGPLLILYAFAEEGAELARQMTIETSDTLLGRAVLTGTLSGKKVIVAESGMGMTNAAMMAQALIDKYRPARLVFSGIAGGIDSSVAIGDIVVCESWATHDYLYLGKDKTEMMRLTSFSASGDSLVRVNYFQVDTLLYRIAQGVAAEKSLLEKIGDRYPRILTGGQGVSGNSFVDNAEKRIWLQQTFTARITDMESAAVAQVCTANGVPFIIFRSASDLAGGAKSETASEQLERFFQVAAKNSATVVIRFITLL